MSALRHELRVYEREFCDRLLSAGSHAAKYHTLCLVEECLAEGVPGDFAECGVMAGAHPAIMLHVLKKYRRRDKRVHLFDSFRGIPRATAGDNEADQHTYGLSDGKMQSSGVSAFTVERVVANLKRWGVYDEELVVIHEGWFEETLARDAESMPELAVLRVDVDLYQATMEVFQHLYPKVTPGGFVVDDDYGSEICKNAMESIAGVRASDVTPIDGQPTTVWWRKT